MTGYFLFTIAGMARAISAAAHQAAGLSTAM